MDEVQEALAKQGYCVACPNPAEYHAMKPLLRNYISYSSLKWFAQSPYLYQWHKQQGEPEPTQAMRIGDAADCLALTPQFYDSRFALVDKVSLSPRVETLLKCMQDPAAKWSVEEKKVRLRRDGKPYENGEQDPMQKAAWEARTAKGEYIFSPEENAQAQTALSQKLKGITRITEEEHQRAESIAEATTAAIEHYGLSSVQPQVAVWCRLDKVGAHKLAHPITLCCMADMWQEEKDRVLDLKTTAANIFSSRKLAFFMDDMAYNIQAGIESLLYPVVTGRRLQSFADLFISTAPPHFSRMMEFDRTALDEAESYVMQLLVDYDKCLASGDFGTPYLETKDYALEKAKPITVYETEE